jgi:hypothetical protein
MKPHQIARDITPSTARVDVEADESHALRCEVLASDGKHLVPDRIGYPGIDAVRDNEVELTESARHIHDVAMFETDIAQTEFGHGPAPIFDLACAEVDAKKRAVGILVGDRDQVAANATAELQHATARRKRWSHAEKGRHCAEMSRMGLRERLARVANLVIRRFLAVHGSPYGRHPR